MNNQDLSRMKADVDELIKKARMTAKTGNPTVLGVTQIRMMQAQKAGYPKDLYHEHLSAVHCLDEDEEKVYRQNGYVEYANADWPSCKHPKMLFRRNFATIRVKDTKGNFLKEEFKFMGPECIEDKTAMTPKEETELLNRKPEVNCSKWFGTVSELPALDEAPAEDPAVTIARLQGEIEAMKSMAEKPKK